MTVRSLLSTLLLAAIASSVACAPATTFANIAVDYRPSPSVTGVYSRVTGSAITFAESDKAALDQAGAVYLGEIEVHGVRGGLVSGGAGPANLTGRSSLEAAQRGASHFILLTGDVQRITTGTDVVVTRYGAYAAPRTEQDVTARYALLRVEPGHWQELPPALRPEPLVAQ